MRHRVIDLGVTLEEPPGWHVRDWWVRRASVVALVPNDRRDEPAEWLSNCLGVSTPRESHSTLLETADAAMRA